MYIFKIHLFINDVDYGLPKLTMVDYGRQKLTMDDYV